MRFPSYLLEQSLDARREVGLQQAPELLPGQGLQPQPAAPHYSLGTPASPLRASFDTVNLAARVQAVPLMREGDLHRQDTAS